MKSDEDYFSRNMTYFNVFLRILRLGENTRILPYFITGLNVRNNYATSETVSYSVILHGIINPACARNSALVISGI